jgi:hypothetical protein
MDDEKFQWLLDSKRLLMPSADRLGDPLEGTTPQGVDNWWRKQAEIEPDEEKRRIINNNRVLFTQITDKNRKDCYVSCWHTNQDENREMWNRYTKTKQSVAIRTTYTALRNCLPEYAFLGMVQYINYRSSDAENFVSERPLNVLNYITHKDSFFTDENEVRAVVWLLNMDVCKDHYFEKESSPGFFVFAPPVDLNKLVLSTVFHPSAPVEYKTKVKEQCVKLGLPVPEPSGFIGGKE